MGGALVIVITHARQAPAVVAGIGCPSSAGGGDSEPTAQTTIEPRTRRAAIDFPVHSGRAQDVRTGHNVVVYYDGEGGTITIDAGVEVFTDFAAGREDFLVRLDRQRADAAGQQLAPARARPCRAGAQCRRLSVFSAVRRDICGPSRIRTGARICRWLHGNSAWLTSRTKWTHSIRRRTGPPGGRSGTLRISLQTRRYLGGNPVVRPAVRAAPERGCGWHG